MKLYPRIVYIEPKKLIGISMKMSLVNNKTQVLWKTFMPRRREINNRLNDAFISLQVYDDLYFNSFDPARNFIKWAAVEVSSAINIPNGLSTYLIPEGEYAVFDYKGIPGNPAIFQQIYGEWLLASEYDLDLRPHFEVLGPDYKPGSPESEEEIWIPVANKESITGTEI